MTSLKRDPQLFSPERIKEHFIVLLSTCATWAERASYLRSVHYHGVVGDGNDITSDRACAEYFVRRITDPVTIDVMYALAVEAFAHRPPKAQLLTSRLKTVDGGEVVLSAVPDASFLYVGRSDSVNDWHYQLRCRLYGFDDEVIKAMPLSGVAVKKRCQQCGTEKWPLLVCDRCRDVYYCDRRCFHRDTASHIDYCQQSQEAQRQHTSPT